MGVVSETDRGIPVATDVATIERRGGIDPRIVWAAILVVAGIVLAEVVRMGGAGRLFVESNDNGGYRVPEGDPTTRTCSGCDHVCGFVNNDFHINLCECAARYSNRHCFGCPPA